MHVADRCFLTMALNRNVLGAFFCITDYFAEVKWYRGSKMNIKNQMDAKA